MKAAPFASAARLPAPAVQAGEYVPVIKVNTVGYLPGWRKVAVFNVPPTHAVVRELGGRIVFEIPAQNIEARGLDPASQDHVWQVDFSALERPGRYVIACDEAESEPFVIADRIY